MAATPEHDTLICLFHHTDRAERTVQELLELGIPQSAITLIGRARVTADIDSGNASLDTINVPEADRKRFQDGLHAGGSVVAVSADSSLAGKIESIFKEYSAEKIDEKALSTAEVDVLSRGRSIDANAFPTTLTGETVDLPPVERVVTMNPPVVETVSAENELARDTDGGRYAAGTPDAVLLVTAPRAVASGSPDILTVEETLVLLQPTDLVEETDLVTSPTDPTGAATSTGRFDPDAPVDDVRNPMSDRLNDPLNRR